MPKEFPKAGSSQYPSPTIQSTDISVHCQEDLDSTSEVTTTSSARSTAIDRVRSNSRPRLKKDKNRLVKGYTFPHLPNPSFVQGSQLTTRIKRIILRILHRVRRAQIGTSLLAVDLEDRDSQPGLVRAHAVYMHQLVQQLRILVEPHAAVVRRELAVDHVRADAVVGPPASHYLVVVPEPGTQGYERPAMLRKGQDGTAVAVAFEAEFLVNGYVREVVGWVHAHERGRFAFLAVAAPGVLKNVGAVCDILKYRTDSGKVGVVFEEGAEGRGGGAEVDVAKKGFETGLELRDQG